MSTIVWYMSMSLDGFMEGPDHDLSWHQVDEEVHQYANDYLRTAGVYLEGRVTFELMADFWPTADQQPDCSPVMAEFAGIWRAMPKHVLSRTLPDGTEWADVILREIDPAAIRALAADADGDVIIGGADVASQFLALGLVDEIHTLVHPVVIGRGTPMFQAPEVLRPLELIDTRTFGNGVVLLRHRVGQRRE